MDDTQLNLRQQHILDVLLKQGPLSRKQIAEKMQYQPTKITLIRDMNALKEQGLILSRGQGRAVRYALVESHPLLSYLDLDAYFSRGPDVREVLHPNFDPQMLMQLKNLFTPEELRLFDAGATQFFLAMQKHPDARQRKELQRFVIEFSWKSSRIEGNTYSLFETENLIRNRSEATGHPREEAIMILNHKDAFDHVLTYRPRFRSPGMEEMLSLHAILTKDLSIEQGIRSNPVRITGTRYLPSAKPAEIRKAMETLIHAAKAAAHPAERAFILLVGIAYIQAFEDGNKRTSRLTSNAVLLAHNLPPLSFRSMVEEEYRQAVLAFYERHSLFHLKRIFIEQFRFAEENYFKD